MKQDPRLSPLQRGFFLTALPIAAIAALVNLLAAAPGSASRLLAALICALSSGLFVLLWRKRRSLRFVSSAALLMVQVLLFGALYTVLFRPSGDLLAQFAATAPWFPIAFISLFLVLEPRRATGVATLLYLASLAMGATYLLNGGDRLLISPLLNLYTANAAVITFLFGYAWFRQQFDHSRSLARSMADLAHTDPLLGIANRRQLQTFMCEELAIAANGGQPAALIMFDLDRFKQINDTYGHDVGDQVLQGIAIVAREVLRNTDRIGRWGGDEFVILASCTDLAQARQLAQRLKETIQQHLSDHFWRVTISVGIAECHPDDTVESWLRRADLALYQAKESGRNRVVVGG